MIRRIVTGTDDRGKATIFSDGEPPRTRRFTHTPGFATSVVWTTTHPAAAGADPTSALRSFVPTPGDTLALAVTFPPHSVFADPCFDPAAAGAEQAEALPGLVELFEAEDPAMHTTPTIDYGVVLSGEIVLDLAGESTVLHPGDTFVQNRTRHAWRNLTDEPATVFFVMLGAAG